MSEMKPMNSQFLLSDQDVPAVRLFLQVPERFTQIHQSKAEVGNIFFFFFFTKGYIKKFKSINGPYRKLENFLDDR